MFAPDPSGSKHILVFFHSTDCGACVGFKPHWPAVKEKIKQNCNIDFLEVELANKSGPIKDKAFPEDLVSFRPEWLPAFALISAKSWQQAKSNKKLPLQGVVFNGVKTGSGWQPVTKNLPYSEAQLIPWIKANLGDQSTIITEPINANYGGYCGAPRVTKTLKF